jgi:Uri superfamily endonuclease
MAVHRGAVRPDEQRRHAIAALSNSREQVSSCTAQATDVFARNGYGNGTSVLSVTSTAGRIQPIMPTVNDADSNAIQITGNRALEGAYILRVQVAGDLHVRFGRFQQSRPLALASGLYLYVGSAMGGGAPLGRRIVRHLTRCEPLPPHRLRQTFISTFMGVATHPGDLLPRRPKRLHWHIDYLLDHLQAEVTGVIALRSHSRHEATIAAQLAADPTTSPIAPGLGASDNRGATHLLRSKGDAGWWRQFGSEWTTRLDQGAARIA